MHDYLQKDELFNALLVPKLRGAAESARALRMAGMTSDDTETAVRMTWEAAQHETDANRKGKLLEDLLVLLIKTIPGFRHATPRRQNDIEEIDILIRIMLAARGSLLQAGANRTGSTAVSGALLYLYLANRMPAAPGLVPVLAPPAREPAPRRALPASAAPLSVCPRCGSALGKHEISGIVLHACVDCGGAWMDNAASQRIVQSFEHSTVVAAHGLGREANKPVDTKELLECPECHGALERVVPGGTKVEVDICREHGTWFDRHEIERIAHAGERARKAKVAAETEAENAAPPTGGTVEPPSPSSHLESSNTYVRGAKNLASSTVIAALGALLDGEID